MSSPMFESYQDRDLPISDRDAEIVRQRRMGVDAIELAKRFDLKVRTVYRILAEAANSVRADMIRDTSQLFVMHNERLERLYQVCEERIEAMSSDAPADQRMPFDDRPIRMALSVLERQAKLNDLDRGRSSVRGQLDWMDPATPTEVVIAEAKRYGIEVPKEFDLPERIVDGDQE